MKSYWTCSKFADWIRGTMKPQSATSKGWHEWKIEAQKNHPIRYWIAEEGLDYVQDFIFWPANKMHAVKYWINNRYVTRTHAMTSNLKKGQWHEYEERLLHCMFDELVNFVEVEQAWFHIAWDEKAREKYNAPWYSWGWFRWRTWRCPEAGLDSLKWASTLTDAEFLDEDKKDQAKPTFQAIVAKEILELYDWWKNVRPKRLDVHEASGWTQICKDRRKKYPDFMWEGESKAEKAATRKALKLSQKIEDSYHKEDEQMMIRLIKIRRGLWT